MRESAFLCSGGFFFFVAFIARDSRKVEMLTQESPRGGPSQMLVLPTKLAPDVA